MGSIFFFFLGVLLFIHLLARVQEFNVAIKLSDRGAAWRAALLKHTEDLEKLFHSGQSKDRI